jgi:hypothetical protein
MPVLLGSIASAIGGGISDIRRAYPAIPEPGVARSLPGFELLSATAASPAHERDVVARYIRDAVARGNSYGDIAVVVRSGSMAESMVTHLNSMSIPTFSETTGSPLRDHPAVWSLLNLVSIGIGREPMTASLAQELLLGPFGRLTILDLRRFRRNLRKAEIGSGGNRLADELILEALTEHGTFETEVTFAHFDWLPTARLMNCYGSSGRAATERQHGLRQRFAPAQQPSRRMNHLMQLWRCSEWRRRLSKTFRPNPPTFSSTVSLGKRSPTTRSLRELRLVQCLSARRRPPLVANLMSSSLLD